MLPKILRGYGKHFRVGRKIRYSMVDKNNDWFVDKVEKPVFNGTHFSIDGTKAMIGRSED
ncbi:hypothetical protein ACFLZ5_03790 [Thermodesulfobacteriota bacterium]